MKLPTLVIRREILSEIRSIKRIYRTLGVPRTTTVKLSQQEEMLARLNRIEALSRDLKGK